MKNKIILGLAATLLLIQFFRPAKNLSNERSNDITTKYIVPPPVADILKVACYDCHSNHTEYPWYAEIQPVAWWLAGHVKGGKEELNFSTFTSRRVAIQNHKLEEIKEQVGEGEMPLASYTNFGLHKGAKLSDAQRKTIVDWAQAQMDTLKAHYPADSLILKKK